MVIDFAETVKPCECDVTERHGLGEEDFGAD